MKKKPKHKLKNKDLRIPVNTEQHGLIMFYCERNDRPFAEWARGILLSNAMEGLQGRMTQAEIDKQISKFRRG